MFLYAESPEQERNTLSHLTESIGLVFQNYMATFCREEQFGGDSGGGGGGGRRRRRRGCYRKKNLFGVKGRGNKEG